MRNEELETISAICDSLMALRKLLSASSDHLCLKICNKILELKILLDDKLIQNDYTHIEMLIKLEEINDLLQKMNFCLSFRQMINPACGNFKSEVGEHIKSIQVLSLQEQINMENMN